MTLRSRNGYRLKFQSPLELFHHIMARSDPQPDGCRLWRNWEHDNYPLVRFNGKQMPAHRFICEFFHGPLLPGQISTHECDVRACVEPMHIRPGTPKSNTQEAILRHKGPYSRMKGS